MLSNSLLLSSLLLTVFGLIAGEDIEFGPCPDPPVQPNFDIQNFTGFWYEIEDYREGFFGIAIKKYKCNTVIITLINPNTIYINSSTVNGITGQRVKRFQEGRLNNASQPAKWTVFTRPDLDEGFYGQNEHMYLYYSILETNYTEYALVWACTGTRDHHHVYSWILSRSDTLSHQTILRIYRNLSKYGLKQSYFRPTNQRYCTYT